METTTATRQLPIRHKNDPCCGVTEEPSLSAAQTVTLAEGLKALGDPTRLGILDLLAQQDEPLCVCDITPRYVQNQPTISHHLRILRESGLIASQKCGIWAFYEATDAGRRWLAAVKTLS